MKDRSQNLLGIRPVISSAKVSAQMSAEEHFQNTTLRPIIKMQNNLFLRVVQQYITKRKNVFFDLSLEKRLAYIALAIQKDIKFRNALKGMIIGHFTEAEYQKYLLHSSALNKRMMQLLIKRIQDQIQVFEKDIPAKAS